MPDLTPTDRATLRAVARAAFPPDWTHEILTNGDDGVLLRHDGIMMTAQCAANWRHVATFDPRTVTALLDAADERDRLRAQLAEKWPGLTHQMRDRLHALCQQAGVCRADQWLSEAACEAIEKETAERDRLAARVEELTRGAAAANDDVCQTLGRALGYPRYCDDPKSFPGATDADGVCVGEHLAESIAMEAADRIRALQAFKTWVHGYLDAHGVPHHPPGTHGAEGCRIGDRMDWLMARLDDMAAENARLRAQVAAMAATSAEPEDTP